MKNPQKLPSLDIWHKFERQGNQVLHVIRTRNTSYAKAMLVAPQMLEALQLLVTARSDNEFTADMIHLVYEKAQSVINKAIGE